MNITKLKYYSTEKLEGILNELENGDGGRGMKDLQLVDFIANILYFRKNVVDTVFRKNQYPY
tara:strand:+ start:540 stop:725 length:186 start_codon:yes stop_codon:yes gene_type:complete